MRRNVPPPPTSSSNQRPQQQSSSNNNSEPTDEEMDRVINQASSTLKGYFATRNVNNDQNWANLHDRQVQERTKIVKAPPAPSSSSASANNSRQNTTTATKSNSGSSSSGGVNALEEIEKLAKLRDMGIVTEQEFQMKKKQLLGL